MPQEENRERNFLESLQRLPSAHAQKSCYKSGRGWFQAYGEIYQKRNQSYEKIISQKKVLIDINETEKSLKKKILTQEHKLYSKSIISIFK